MTSSIVLVFLACTGVGGVQQLNLAPDVKITGPSVTDALAEFAPVLMTATVSDDQTPVDAMTYAAISDVAGDLPVEVSAPPDTNTGDVTVTLVDGLAAGFHNITIVVEDDLSRPGEDTSPIQVVANTGPLTTFIEPTEGSAYEMTTDVLVVADVEDGQESDQSIMSLEWYLDGYLVAGAPLHPEFGGEVSFYLPAIAQNAPGDPHELTLTATDPAGAATSVTVTFDGVARDQDRDGAVTDRLPEGTDCDDFDPKIHPFALEDCFDSIDNDCDGKVDADDPQADCGTGTGSTP